MIYVGTLYVFHRSGGSRTAEGKIRASQNALKTGAYSNQEVLLGENLQELLDLE
jgi:hypothetical protein